jgi:high-affinity nickel-transport protein
VIVGLFVATWAVALTVWKVGRIEEKWSAGIRPGKSPLNS